MDRRLGLSPSDRQAVLRILTMQHGTSHNPAALQALADAITPYLVRSRQPLEQAVVKIARNYLRDGGRIRLLIGGERTPEQKHEWDLVLTWIIKYAAEHSRYPLDTEAVSAPDLDAYEDVRKNLHTYNFEGPLDHWLTTTVSNRIARYWRDRQTKRAGGGGILRTTAQQTGEQMQQVSSAPRAYHLPLDWLLHGEIPQSAIAEKGGHDLNAIVASTQFEQLVVQELQRLANDRNDPLLLSVWDAVVVRDMKLRETAEQFNLTIGQVHRRITQARQHLRNNPLIIQWRDM